MPYKDPERKRQWERDHREQRNARRRMPITVVDEPVTPNNHGYQMPDPYSNQEPEHAWATITGLIGILVTVIFMFFMMRSARSSSNSALPSRPASAD